MEMTMKFDELKINEKLVEKAAAMGFEALMPIQEECIEMILSGRDVVGQAETGSGKTLAFGVPMLHMIEPGKGIQAIILTPTRELCVQITDVLKDFGNLVGVKTISVYGGVSIEPQIEGVKTADIVVGTPGRVLDHMERRTLNLGKVRFLVIDETDRMLDMGFIDDVEEIIRHTPKERQTLMFSATIHWAVEEMMKKYLKDPVIVRTQSYVDPGKLQQFYYDIHYQQDKFPLLVHLLRESTPGLAIVFCATREEAAIVAWNLRKQGIDAMEIHGGMTQSRREKSLDALKTEQTSVLVATDVAARGLDIKNVTHVYNYDVPKTAKDYIHRIGRTARAGEEGYAVTLLTSRDHDNLRRILREEEVEIHPAEMPYFQNVPFNRDVEVEGGRRFSGRDGPRRSGGFRGRGGYGGGDRRGQGGHSHGDSHYGGRSQEGGGRYHGREHGFRESRSGRSGRSN
jgi:ATP-dependent RNA helicase DeaD